MDQVPDRHQRRARAADVLLAALHPAAAQVWETNPWKQRRDTWKRQAPRLIEAAFDFVARHSVGRRTPRGWRFVPDLVARMARAGAITSQLKHDPWRRPVRPWHLRSTDSSFSFSQIARTVAPQKLEQIYRALGGVWRQLKLRRERVPRLARKKWPLVLPRDLLARLVRRGKLQPHQVVDPWGNPYRVRWRPRLFVDPYYTGLVSRYIVYSAGPDGKAGTRDDIRPRGPTRVASVFGRDSALGSDSADALGALVGGQIGEAYGVGGLGLVGTGRGGGGSGSGTISLGSLGTIGRGGAALPGRVRSRFPETLLWQPELITDAAGRATLDVDLADSITTWRLLATGSTRGGLLGRSAMTLKVFQDFFVDLDLPVALTQGDRVSVPVTVYNYLARAQTITLRLQPEAWFSAAGATRQSITLGPSQVGVRYFPIVAHKVGRQDLTVSASAAGASGVRSMADAVRRTLQVEPDGVQHAVSHGGPLRPATVPFHDLELPAAAIDGTRRVELAIYAGPLSQTQEGLAGMLRMPGSCFEQTSSTTYPNVLVLHRSPGNFPYHSW